ncbi:TetR/AcrR family transcriptional regulator [Microbacterium sp. HJ5]
MPRVTVAYREARRDEIARAALRCLVRKGVRDTSIADIVTESGLSTGAIYSHFSSKAELARYIVARYLVPHVETLEARARKGDVIAPRAVLATLLRAFEEHGLPPSVVVQFWAEAMVDPDLLAQVSVTAERLRASLQAALQPWADASGVAAPAVLAADTVRAVMALTQGWIAHTAVFGSRSVNSYIESATAALTE